MPTPRKQRPVIRSDAAWRATTGHLLDEIGTSSWTTTVSGLLAELDRRAWLDACVREGRRTADMLTARARRRAIDALFTASVDPRRTPGRRAAAARALGGVRQDRLVAR